MQQQEMIRDDTLMKYISELFGEYDKEGRGTINSEQMTGFFNHLFLSQGVNMQLNESQAIEAIRLVNPTYSGAVTQQQLFATFKALLALTANPTMMPGFGYGGQMGGPGYGYMNMGGGQGYGIYNPQYPGNMGNMGK